MTATIAAGAVTSREEIGSPKRSRIAAARSSARPTPSPSPSSDPTAARISASLTTEVVMRRREAPRARSVPISRNRCSTVMLNELRIRKAPTNSAIPEKK